jgi:hypothetical protein
LLSDEGTIRQSVTVMSDTEEGRYIDFIFDRDGDFIVVHTREVSQ